GLMRRMRKLEAMVEDLSGQIEIETSMRFSNGGSPEGVHTSQSADKDASAAGSHSNGNGTQRDNSVSGASTHSTGSHGSASNVVDHSLEGDSPNVNALLRGFDPLKSLSVDVRNQFGRMVLGNHGSTRYVSSA